MTLNEIGLDAYQTAIEKGFYEEPPTFGERIALIHSELSETLEEYRKDYGFNETYFSYPTGDVAKPEGIPSELADVVIRICDLCHHYNINLEEAIRVKLEYNKTRTHKNGGKKI